jgi:hypothetical protein
VGPGQLPDPEVAQDREGVLLHRPGVGLQCRGLDSGGSGLKVAGGEIAESDVPVRTDAPGPTTLGERPFQLAVRLMLGVTGEMLSGP